MAALALSQTSIPTPSVESTLRAKLAARDSQIQILHAQISVLNNALNNCMSTIGGLALQDPPPEPVKPTPEVH